VAELFSAFLCAQLGFSKCISNNAAYLQGWLSHLENDNKFIFRASSQAQKACDFIMENVLQTQD